MELCLDIYPIILSYVDWFTLQNFKRVNQFSYFFSKKEIKSRLKSNFPFGDRNAKISIKTNDINLESISIIINEIYIPIPREKYNLSWINGPIEQWFIFCLQNHHLILTGKLFKSIIRIFNKRTIQISENQLELIFRYNEIKDEFLKTKIVETVLEDII